MSLNEANLFPEPKNKKQPNENTQQTPNTNSRDDQLVAGVLFPDNSSESGD
jgi:hypothetical protein